MKYPKLHTGKFALGTASAGLLFYLSCLIFMSLAGHDFTIWIFNALLHGLDVQSILRDRVPMGQTLAGLLLTAVIFGGIGFTTSLIYNYLITKSKKQ